jgi:hypothetical protein
VILDNIVFHIYCIVLSYLFLYFYLIPLFFHLDQNKTCKILIISFIGFIVSISCVSARYRLTLLINWFRWYSTTYPSTFPIFWLNPSFWLALGLRLPVSCSHCHLSTEQVLYRLQLLIALISTIIFGLTLALLVIIYSQHKPECGSFRSGRT